MIKDVIIITGPTAVGKSEIAVEIAKTVGGEIISADSMQIYRGLNVGSGKITPEEMQGVKHYLLDIKSINQTYSVAEFCEDCKKIIKQIMLKGKVPIIVGGTGLYIKALTNDYNYFGVKRDDELREELEKFAEKNGLNDLYEMLKKLSPVLAEKISPTDKKRIVRALEICKSKKREIKVNSEQFTYKVFALNTERSVLYDRINQRVNKMIQSGLVEEVKKLVGEGLTRDNQCAKGIGYAEILDYLDGTYSLSEAIEKIKQHSRNYAKRQLTLLRGIAPIWIEAFPRENAIKEILKEVEYGLDN